MTSYGTMPNLTQEFTFIYKMDLAAVGSDIFAAALPSSSPSRSAASFFGAMHKPQKK